MKKIFYSLIIASVFLVSGCGTLTSSNQISSNQVPDKLPANNGFLIGSFSSDNGSSITFNFRSLDGKTKDRLISGNMWASDYKNNKFVYSLPEGNYEFYNFSIMAGVLGGTKTWSAKDDFSIPFKIEHGKSTYVGSIESISKTGENIFGITIPAGGCFVISDKSQTDLSLLKANYPFLDMGKVVIAVPKSGNVPPQLVQFK